MPVVGPPCRGTVRDLLITRRPDPRATKTIPGGTNQSRGPGRKEKHIMVNQTQKRWGRRNGKKEKPENHTSTLRLDLASRLLARLPPRPHRRRRLCLFGLGLARRYELVPTNVVFIPLLVLVVRRLWYLVLDLPYHLSSRREKREM